MTVLQLVIFSGILLTAVIAQMGGDACKISIEKDWIVRIANKNTSMLTHYNTVIRRIDLLCKLLAPFSFGVYLSLFSLFSRIARVRACLLLLGGWNLLGLFPEYFSLLKIYNDTEELRHKEKPTKAKVNAFVGMIKGWKHYINHSLFFASFGYCFLYFSVLDNGALMMAYLLYAGVDEALLGASRGGGALFGLLGTIVFPLLYPRCMGVRGAGRLSIWLFLFFVAPGGLILLAGSNSTLPGYIMMICVMVARVWLWSFDLAHTQAMQEGVQEKEIGILYTCQTGVYQLLYVVLYVFGMIFSRPVDFPVLTSLTILGLFTAAMMWTLWSCCKPCVNRYDMSVEQVANAFAKQKEEENAGESRSEASRSEESNEESDEPADTDETEQRTSNSDSGESLIDSTGEDHESPELTEAEQKMVSVIEEAAVKQLEEEELLQQSE